MQQPWRKPWTENKCISDGEHIPATFHIITHQKVKENIKNGEEKNIMGDMHLLIYLFVLYHNATLLNVIVLFQNENGGNKEIAF